MNDYFTNVPVDPMINERFEQVQEGFDKLPAPDALQQNRWFYLVASGDANEITATLPYDLTSYVEGLAVRLKIDETNTDAVTLTLNGLDPIDVRGEDGSALTAGMLATGQIYDLVFDGTVFRLLGDTIPADILENRWFYLVAGGGADEITATFPYELTSYVEGLGIRLKIDETNTGPTTIALNGLDPVDVRAADGSALAAEVLVENQIYDLVFDGAAFRLLAEPLPTAVLENRWFYAAADGAPDVITAILPYGLAAYTEGLAVRLKIDEDNSGPVTLALNGLAATDIRASDGSALTAGALVENQVYDLIYDGTVFRLLGEVLLPDSVLAAILTVDGPGSGLNADLVHGVDPSAFALTQLAAADAAAGRTLLSLGAVITSGTYLGIDEASPTYKVHAGTGSTPADTTIAFGSTPTLYLPAQTNLIGSIAVGDGLRSLAHTDVDTGQGNTVIGIGAGQNLTTGRLNTLGGYDSGKAMTALTVNNTFGGVNGNSGCTFYGAYTGVVANGAYDCTMVGTQCGLNLTTGMDLCGFGINTLRDCEGAGETAAFGHAALQYIVGSGTYDSGTGHRLSAFGDMAGRYLNPDGEGNQANKTGGKSSVYIGARTSSASNTAINENVFGYETRGKGSNTVVIGNSNVTASYVAGHVFTPGHQTTSTERPNAYIDATTGEIKRSTLPVDTGWVSYSPTITLQSGGPPTYTSNTEVRVIDGDCSWEGTFTMSSLNGGSGAIKIVLPYTPKRSGGCAVFLGPNGAYALGQMTWVAGSKNAIIVAYSGSTAPSVVPHCFRAQYLVQ